MPFLTWTCGRTSTAKTRPFPKIVWRLLRRVTRVKSGGPAREASPPKSPPPGEEKSSSPGEVLDMGATGFGGALALRPLKALRRDHV